MSSVSSSDESYNNDTVNGGRTKGGAKRTGTSVDKQGEELATKVLSIQSKRFYLDVKQNDRGRFIKFAEVAGGGKKSRIFMSMRTSNQFKDHLEKFLNVFENLGTQDDNQSTLLHSETIVNDKRRYYLDLRENNRGRFLRITQMSVQAGTRFSIALPAQGISQLRDALIQLLSEYGDDSLKVELPEGRSLRAESNKTFYFDPGQNDRGNFLKISEVKPQIGLRSSITISARSLTQFCAIINELQPKIVQQTPSKGKSADRVANNNNDGDSATIVKAELS